VSTNLCCEYSMLSFMLWWNTLKWESFEEQSKAFNKNCEKSIQCLWSIKIRLCIMGLNEESEKAYDVDKLCEK